MVGVTISDGAMVIPAIAPSSVAIPMVTSSILEMLIPIRLAISASWAVALIAMPSFVLDRSSHMAIITTITIPIVSIYWAETLIPSISTNPLT